MMLYASLVTNHFTKRTPILSASASTALLSDNNI